MKRKEEIVEEAQKEADYGCRDGVEEVLYRASRENIYLPGSAVDGFLEEAEKNYESIF